MVEPSFINDFKTLKNAKVESEGEEAQAWSRSMESARRSPTDMMPTKHRLSALPASGFDESDKESQQLARRQRYVAIRKITTELCDPTYKFDAEVKQLLAVWGQVRSHHLPAYRLHSL